MKNSLPLIMDVAILAGGKGTRLKSRSNGMPKPMVLLNGIPTLEHLICICRENGFKNILLLLCEQYEVIQKYFGDGSKWGVHLEYRVESVPSGTAGAIIDSLHLMGQNFFVLYGDTYLKVDLNSMWHFHIEKDADATLFLHPNSHPADSDLVSINAKNRVMAIHPYPHPIGSSLINLVNAGLCIINKRAINGQSLFRSPLDLAKDLFPKMLAQGKFLNGYVSCEYIKDMGTPDRLDSVSRDIELGVPNLLSNVGLRSAVFLDRDGTIIKEVGHLNSPSQVELIPGASTAIKKLNKAGVLSLCITNQPVLARGDITFKEYGLIQSRLESLLGDQGCYLDRTYTCPHHPDSGYRGEVADLKIECSCRKPGIKLIEDALTEFNINRASSWIVGDSTADLQAGKTAGIKTILVQTGHAGSDKKYKVEPDFIMNDIDCAIEWIMHGYERATKELSQYVKSIPNTGRLVLVGGAARAGKSTLSKVLLDLVTKSGRTAHIINLDGWLKSIDERGEGGGILSRYDEDLILKSIIPLLAAEGEVFFERKAYDRQSRKTYISNAVGIMPDDLIIVEGVPALLMPKLNSCADLKIYISTDESIRLKRMFDDYISRGKSTSFIEIICESRSKDELPEVLASKKNADIVLGGALI